MISCNTDQLGCNSSCSCEKYPVCTRFPVVIDPSSVLSSPIIVFTKVDFPAPFAPIKPTTSPRRKVVVICVATGCSTSYPMDTSSTINTLSALISALGKVKANSLSWSGASNLSSLSNCD